MAAGPREVAGKSGTWQRPVYLDRDAEGKVRQDASPSPSRDRGGRWSGSCPGWRPPRAPLLSQSSILSQVFKRPF